LKAALGLIAYCSNCHTEVDPDELSKRSEMCPACGPRGCARILAGIESRRQVLIMYFVVEYQGKRKTVKAKASAIVTEVNHLAFGFEELGDVRAKDVRIIGATRRADVAAGMMCRVWPAQETK
jgi:hypothetical protein